jgi:hypothetical protein
MYRLEKISGSEDYGADTNGDIWSFKKDVPKKLAKTISTRGYYKISICNNGKVKISNVHKLVALAFLGSSNGLDVNHRNGNKLDNRLENLEYVTEKENAIHSCKNRLSSVGEKHYKAALSDKQAREIEKELALGTKPKVLANRYQVTMRVVYGLKYKETYRN